MARPYAMVVEDDSSVAALFQRALADAGYQAEIMENGHKAQAKLMFTTPDLVLLDLHLPSLEGAVLLRQIRSQVRLVHTRVVLVSGDALKAERHSDQADGVLIKPAGYEQVRRLAEELAPISIE
jgi:two-component system response regulator protein GraR